jgi:ABC-type Fe3+-hydroxamate transport system substrate-binding protein
METIVAQQPEYLLLVRESGVTLEGLRSQGNWMKLRAVKEGKIFYADDRIEFPSPMAFDALEHLASEFHPQLSRRFMETGPLSGQN